VDVGKIRARRQLDLQLTDLAHSTVTRLEYEPTCYERNDIPAFWVVNSQQHAAAYEVDNQKFLGN
jgi:hypothetical protein